MSEEAGASEGDAAPRSAVELLAAAGWDGVSAKILEGVCHELNGRAAGLEGLAVLVAKREVPSGLPKILGRKVESLQDAVATLAALTGDPDAPAEPAVAGDLLRDALLLHRSYRPFAPGSIEVSPDLPPVLVGWARLRRVLTLIMHQAIQENAPGVGPLVVLGGSQDEVSFAFGAEVGPGSTGSMLPRVREALAGVLRRDRGTLEVDEGGRAVVRVPSLARARATAS